jgi:NAD(P)H-dependent FMN reductase
VSTFNDWSTDCLTTAPHSGIRSTNKLTSCSSYSKLLAYEVCRILWRLGCDVRVYDPSGLPMKDDVQQAHPKVQELRDLSRWSDGHFWVSPEQHGNLVCALDFAYFSPFTLEY